MKGATGFALLCVLVSGCAGLSSRDFHTFAVDTSRDAQIVYHGLPLNSGDLIVSDAAGPDTLLLSLLGETHSSFVHSGIVVIEHGRPYVYEAYATINPFFRGPPTDAMQGGIQRVTLEDYLSRQRISAVFVPAGPVDSMKVAEFAQARHRDGTSFDAYFDWRDHSRLYCTEFAALALQAGGAKFAAPVPVRNNRSLRVALDWMRVTTPVIMPAEALIQGARRVALLSRRDTQTQIESYFAAKRELHERFTDDQKLGNIWRWSWRGLELRPEIEAFLAASRTQTNVSAPALANRFFEERPPSAAQLETTHSH